MASTYSTALKLELMATGDQSGTWGNTTNTNLGTLLEQAITGVLSVAQGDVANLTLTSLDGASDQARNAVVDLTGALTAGRNVVVPTAEKVYLIKNSTSGGFALTVKTAAGSGVSVAAGTSRWVYCDGTNVVDGLVGTLASQVASAVAITGGTIAGLTTLTMASGAATPATNDAAALGTASLSWSDLFLASGGVVNIANGNWVATHTSGILTIGTGDLRVTTAGTNAASVVTVGGAQTLASKTLTAPTVTGIMAAAAATFSSTITMNGNACIFQMSETDTGQNWYMIADGSQFDFRPTSLGTTSIFMLTPTTVNFTAPVLAHAGVSAETVTAIPAGGTAGAGFKFSSTANFGVFFGSGAPTLSAAKGSLYLRSDGSSTSTRLYVNTNGSTTWTNVTTAA